MSHQRVSVKKYRKEFNSNLELKITINKNSLEGFNRIFELAQEGINILEDRSIAVILL